MFRTTKKEQVFFDLFACTMDDICKAAALLGDLMTNYTDIDAKVHAIEELEHTCDIHFHNMMEQINKAFITPIDREDIFAISKQLDDIADNIESTAHRFVLFNIETIRPEAIEMGKLIIKCTDELKSVIEDLKNMKKSKTLHKKIIEVNNIENQGDMLYRDFIMNLFMEKDSIDILKWKEIFEFMESTLDACEDVANVIEGVVMKHA